MIKRHYLYRITNNKNGKVYIGQSVDPNRRWNTHRKNSVFPKYTIHHAMKKYGIDNFTFEVISSGILSCSCVSGKSGPCRADANILEVLLISQYGCLGNKNGYNETIGGNGGNASHSVLEETRLKISQTLKGHKLSEETKAKIADATSSKGWKLVNGERVWFLADESYIKAREEAKNKLPEPRENVWLGRKHTEETKLKMGQRFKDRVAKTGYPNQGRKASDESRAKMSEAHKGQRPGTAKLKEQDVRTIKQMLKKNQSTKIIAKMFSVSTTTILNIKNGIIWKDIS